MKIKVELVWLLVGYRPGRIQYWTGERLRVDYEPVYVQAWREVRRLED